MAKLATTAISIVTTYLIDLLLTGFMFLKLNGTVRIVNYSLCAKNEVSGVGT